MTAPPPAATPPPEPAWLPSDFVRQLLGTYCSRARSDAVGRFEDPARATLPVSLVENLIAGEPPTPAPGVSAAPSATSPTDASGETREAVYEYEWRDSRGRWSPLGSNPGIGSVMRGNHRYRRRRSEVVRTTVGEWEQIPTATPPGPEASDLRTAVEALHRQPAVILNHGELVMAYEQTRALLAAPGPDTARDGETTIGPATRMEAWTAQVQLRAERDAARRERDDLKAAVEGLAVCPLTCDDDCEQTCHEAHATREHRRHWPEDCPSVVLGALLTPPDAGRDTG